MTVTEYQQYGVVQDDGTVVAYPSERAAERAGRIEALVVRAKDGSWVYPATGRTFHPSDVEGLSPATASDQAGQALKKVYGAEHRGRIVSYVPSANPTLMLTQMQVIKQPGWERLAARMESALLRLPNVVEFEQTGDEPMYNYFFFKVIRRRK